MNTLLRSRQGMMLVAFVAMGAVYLVTEHTAHVLSAMPYLLLLLCPVMHLFMHRSHGGHGNHSADNSRHVEHATGDTQPSDGVR